MGFSRSRRGLTSGVRWARSFGELSEYGEFSEFINGTAIEFATVHFGAFTMVVIRLARGGAKRRPFFNIVATDSRNSRDGRFIERVGFYNPVATGGEVRFRVAVDRLTHWRAVGAQVSPTVARLLKQHPHDPAGAAAHPAAGAAADGAAPAGAASA